MLIYEFKKFMFSFFFFCSCWHLLTNQIIWKNFSWKSAFFCFSLLTSNPFPCNSLLIASDSTYSGDSPHGSSSTWYICTLFHDLLTSDNIYWISDWNCKCLVSSILEMQIVISWRFLQFTSFLDKVPQGIRLLLSLCLPLFLSLCLRLFPPLPNCLTCKPTFTCSLILFHFFFLVKTYSVPLFDVKVWITLE